MNISVSHFQPQDQHLGLHCPKGSNSVSELETFTSVSWVAYSCLPQTAHAPEQGTQTGEAGRPVLLTPCPLGSRQAFRTEDATVISANLSWSFTVIP